MDKSTEALASYAGNFRFEEIPAEVLHSAKCKVIDALGCAMGGYPTELCTITRAMAQASTGSPSARVLGSQAPSTPAMAAFANGTMVHAQDFNDVYMSQSTCHPSDGLSGVLATADALGASGASLLAATILSYEVSCNFADVIPREQGLDNTFYCLVGSALASARLMGLDMAQLQNTVALAVVPNVTLEQTRTGALSMWKNCAGANAARNAVFAAEAARAGLTGPDAPIEGKWGLWNNLGLQFEWAPFGGAATPYRISQTNLKRYPAVAHAQSPITAALQLREGLRVEDIEAIAIESYWVAKRFEDPRSPLWSPASHETAGNSIPYLVAVALTDGDVTEQSFDAGRLADPRLHALIKKTTIRETAAFNALYPSEWPCRIEITLTSGDKRVAETRYFKGHTKSPLSEAEVETKFRQLAAPVLAASDIEKILASLWKLEEVSDIRTVLGLFAAVPH
ncbi:MAG TPA: MmgE/PrpD family protein [Burkholderiales bacterium]|jgi:2-methylcitrate dehydratase|nr:MmgE/PrpD family protein [Burkholderiales bacterium]